MDVYIQSNSQNTTVIVIKLEQKINMSYVFTFGHSNVLAQGFSLLQGNAQKWDWL